jgi:trehalose 6-phosphate synthase/phosphatase
MNKGSIHEALQSAIKTTSNPLLLLDYDGTLVPFYDDPEGAAPDSALLQMLRGLHERDDVSLCIISGRSRYYLEKWFGQTDMLLVAEHGLWHRNEKKEWIKIFNKPVPWQDEVMRFTDGLIERYPETRADRKEVSIVWHFRCCHELIPPDIENEFHEVLDPLFDKYDLQALKGHDIIEVRPKGLNKGNAVSWLAKQNLYDLVMAMGDDSTDEDMFEYLGGSAVTARVGGGESRAKYRLADYKAARDLLHSLMRNENYH